MLSKVNAYFEGMEFNRYGIMAMTITAGSCLGSVAVMYIAVNDGPLWQIAVCAAVSMLSNTTAIALSPMKVLLWSFILNLVVNSVFILMNL